MRDFQGWDAGAMWEEAKFDTKHFKEIERIAAVGDKRWEKWVTQFCVPFTKASIRYFDRADEVAARKWLGESRAASA
jgi:hypothetical protein